MDGPQREAEPAGPRRRARLLVAVVGGAAALAIVAALWGCWGSVPGRRSSPAAGPPAQVVPPAGGPAPDFTLPVLSGGAPRPGGRLSLRSLRGHPVVLNFWASWCAPCREETPVLVRLHRQFAPRGVVFVGVDVEDQATDARRFLAQYHVDYTIVASSGEKLVAAYAVPGLPTTVFIGPDGVIRGRRVGGFIGPEGARALAGELDRLLGAGQ